MSGTALLYAACKPSEPKKSETTVRPVLETSHRSLTNDEYDTVAAAVERICPRDEEPGPSTSGCRVHRPGALHPTLAHVRDDFVRGTEALMRRAQSRHSKPFATLTPEHQDALLTEFKDLPGGSGEQHYWTVLIGLTMEGLFGDPVHGGNKAGRGWELIGFGQGRRGCAGPSGHHHHHGCETRKG
jgi:gluconate 2-dehydrogenase gamma chain